MARPRRKAASDPVIEGRSDTPATGQIGQGFRGIARKLEGGTEISDPSIWQDMAIVCAQYFEEMSKQDSPLSSIRSMALCADEHIKSKIMQLKGSQTAGGGLDELRRTVEAALSSATLNTEESEGWGTD